MFDNLRWSANNSNSPIAGALLRSLNEHGDLSIPSLRALSPLSDKAQVLVDSARVGQSLGNSLFGDLMKYDPLGLLQPQLLDVPLRRLQNLFFLRPGLPHLLVLLPLRSHDLYHGFRRRRLR